MSGKNNKKLRKLVNKKHKTDIDKFNATFNDLLNGMPITYRARYAWKVLVGRIGN